ncbi:uncharacterized protein LOC110268451 [Arachis ipaensis]|uniref:uncharacterized protein LOC110268451 n=1 Tax=Arachis ipaensis TaxID=130454 RepID=UPI000A2B92D0|nr:uncharacterized protein LOC110268451 [Arachis ipaensis]
MKAIIDLRFRELTGTVDVMSSISSLGDTFAMLNDVQVYLNRPSMAGGVCKLDQGCSVSAILMALKKELDNLYASMENGVKEIPTTVIVEKSLFIGRLLFAFQNHSKHIPLILGFPRFWIRGNVFVIGNVPSLVKHSRFGSKPSGSDSPGRQTSLGSKRQTSSAAPALLGAREGTTHELEELNRTIGDLCIRAYNLWILWLSDELSAIVSQDLKQDDALSLSTPWRGWEDTIVKQDQSDENQLEWKHVMTFPFFSFCGDYSLCEN